MEEVEQTCWWLFRRRSIWNVEYLADLVQWAGCSDSAARGRVRVEDAWGLFCSRADEDGKSAGTAWGLDEGPLSL